MQEQDEILIKASGINQSFQVGEENIDVLKDVNFEIAHNSFNVIYGVSGSGKSTLLNIITGLQKPSKGNILFKNQDIYKLKGDDLARFRASRIGIIYQQNYWVQSLNVVENVALPLYFLGYNRALAKEMAMISLERIDMQSYAKKFPTLMSGGEQQRVAVARALVNDPLFIIADEPTGSLDTTNGDKVMGLLRKAHSESLRTIILVTHNMEYLPLADNLLHVQDGTVENSKDESIKRITNSLINDMKSRLDEFSKAKVKTGGNK